MNRRTFLGAGVFGAVSAGASQFHRIAHGETQRAPTRLLVIHKPVGTSPAFYDCAGEGGRDFTLSPILEPFADLRERMVIIEGVDILKKENTPVEDHGNSIVTAMTGGITFKDPANNIAVAERTSIDQLLASVSAIAGDAPIRSLQIAGDVRSTELFTRVLSYAGRGQPLPPEGRPFATYAHLFGSLADPGLDAAGLVHARARRQSVLDFARGGLSRIAPRLGSEERGRLDRHLEAIRTTERLLDRTVGVDPSALEAQAKSIDMGQLDKNHGAISRAQLELVRVAFQCDLTRIVTFGWASGQSYVNFSQLIPGVQDIDFHTLSHGGTNLEQDEALVHRWYNEHLAAFLRSLRDTPDVDGRTLLDNTLVVVWSEMRYGHHTFQNVPIQLFGGGGLPGGRLLRYDHRSMNDLWLAIANQLGHPMTCFGDRERCVGPLPGLFADRPWSGQLGETRP